MSNIISVNQDSFEQEVVQSDLPVLVDFWAPSCGPCMALMPAVESLAKMYAGRLKIVKVNTDDNKELMERFNVRSIPQLFLMKGGEKPAAIHGRTRTRLDMELEALIG